MIVKLAKNIFISHFFIQLILCAALFYRLTGLAFLTDWRFHSFFSAHRQFHLFLLNFTLFLGICLAFYLYSRDKDRFFRLEPMRSLNALYKLPPLISVSTLCVLYFLIQFSSLFFMHIGHGTYLWDLGFYDQVIWNTAFGEFLVTSVRGGLHIFCEHFKPIIILLALLYRIIDNTNFLLGAQCLFISTTLWAAYGICRHITKSHFLSLSAAIAVFFYQPLRNGILFPFHTSTLADPLLLFGFLFAVKNRKIISVIFFVLAMMCKENIALDVFGIGLFLFAGKKSMSKTIILISVCCLMLIVFVTDPAYRWPYHVLNKWNYYAHLRSLDFSLWCELLTPNPMVFLFLIFAPFLFLSFRCAHWFLLLGPSLGLRLLSAMKGFRMITAAYTSGLNSLVIISAIYGLEAIKTATKKNIGIAIVFASLFCSGVPYLFVLEQFVWDASFSDHQKTNAVLDQIPSRYSVLTTETLSSHLSHRKYLFVFNNIFPHTPLVELAEQPDLIIIDQSKIHEVPQDQLLKFRKQGYELIFDHRLQIYRHPLAQDVSSETVKDWTRQYEKHTIPYRKIMRRWYKNFLVMMLVMFALVWWKKRNQAGSFRES